MLCKALLGDKGLHALLTMHCSSMGLALVINGAKVLQLNAGSLGKQKGYMCVGVCCVGECVCVCVCLWCGVCGVLCSGHAGLAGFCGFGLMQYLYCCFLLVFCLMKNTSFQILHHQKSIQTLTKRPRNTPVQILHQPNNPSKPSKTVVQILHQPNNPNKPSKTVVQILHHKKTKGN